MWKLFKSKEEKQKNLEKELVELNNKYFKEINSYCKINCYIFILKGFKIENNKIYIQYIDKDTINGYVNNVELWFFELKYGTLDFKKARFEFIVFKDELKKIGIKLEKLNNE